MTVEPCGKRLVTIDGDGILRQWNIGATQEYQTLVPHRAPIEDIEFSPLNYFIVTASDDGGAQVWSVPPFQLTPPVLQYRDTLRHKDRVDDVDISPDGKLIATASWDGTAVFWDAAWLTSPAHPEGLTRSVLYAIAFRPPDARQVATGGKNGRVILLSTETGAMLKELLPPNNGAVFALAFSPRWITTRDGS